MPTSQPAGAIEALLRDLGPRLRRGPAASENRLERCSTGLPDLDRLLGGGFPRGRLSEIAGPASSGRTSIAQALLADLTRSGSVVAVVDLADAFDPPSAKCVGVELRRVLWVRAPQLREALRSTERLLQASGFALVLLDLAARSTAPDASVPLSSWLRLGRAAAASRTALVVLSQRRCTGTAAELAVEMAPTHSRFTGSPALFEGLTARVTPVRSRSDAGEPSPCAPPAC